MEEKTSTRLSLFSLCRVMEAISTTIEVIIKCRIFFVRRTPSKYPVYQFYKRDSTLLEKNFKSN